MLPPSCFWKPQRILINVDLPAPLSPSSPSTSPFFRCRLTSRSAVTGPKLLVMCSTRSTSSADEAGATMCSPGTIGSANARSPPHAPAIGVDRHREQDREAEVEVEVVGVDALDRQAVLQDAQEQRAEQRADHGAGAAEQRRAADHGACDRRQR